MGLFVKKVNNSYWLNFFNFIWWLLYTSCVGTTVSYRHRLRKERPPWSQIWDQQTDADGWLTKGWSEDRVRPRPSCSHSAEMMGKQKPFCLVFFCFSIKAVSVVSMAMLYSYGNTNKCFTNHTLYVALNGFRTRKRRLLIVIDSLCAFVVSEP